MAKTVFHRHQRVFVEPVGTWANIEKIVPHWVKGFDEPVRVFYDCGLGRDFSAEELSLAPSSPQDQTKSVRWRLLRAKNKFQSPEETAHHPYPGTFPVVVTDPSDWGGWRVPGSEYDRDPEKIEFQARLISLAPALYAMAKDLFINTKEQTEPLPSDFYRLAKRAETLCQLIEDKSETSGGDKDEENRPIKIAKA